MGRGEHEDTRYNTLVGEFEIEGLAQVDAGNQIVVRLDLDLNGILKVTATERLTRLAQNVTIDNAAERFRIQQRTSAIDRLEAIFETGDDLEEGPEDEGSEAEAEEAIEDELTPDQREAIRGAEALLARAERALGTANPEDASELKAMLSDLSAAMDRHSEADIRRIGAEVEDLIFYMGDR
jgi:molecular chaperone DnaK